MEITLMVFLKEILLYSEQFVHFGTKMVWCRWPFHFNQLSGFSLILLKKRDQEVHEKFFSCFLRKNLIWGNLIFSSHFLMFDGVWLKLRQATVTIGSLKVRTWLRSFSSLDMISQVNIYVADSVLRHYVIFTYWFQYST